MEEEGSLWRPTVGVRTHIVANCPVLVIVKVDFSLSVGPGEESVGKDPSRTIEG